MCYFIGTPFVGCCYTVPINVTLPGFLFYLGGFLPVRLITIMFSTPRLDVDFKCIISTFLFNV